MRTINLTILITLLTSCAKLSYITTQSFEQIRLVTAGENIQSVIESLPESNPNKQKLIQIKKYKKFFSHFFNEELGGVYEKVIFLDRPSVSYLVVSSPWTEIKAIEECFLFVGCFPYLGFFSEEKASKYREKMIKKGNSSHVRPVNAYSTLGHLNDRVLSSFFNYSEKGLANLIFHELVHSVLFFKDGVNLNENLASFLADELVSIYFSESEDLQKVANKRKQVNREIGLLITKHISEINKNLGVLPKYDKEKKMKDLIIQKFGPSFRVELLEVCQREKVGEDYCLRYKKEWTPSKLAAFGTYGNLQKDIESYYHANFDDITEFYKFLKNKYREGIEATEMIKIIKNKR